jgi:hypothetical protein
LRGSRPVLREPRGAIPLGHSTRGRVVAVVNFPTYPAPNEATEATCFHPRDAPCVRGAAASKVASESSDATTTATSVAGSFMPGVGLCRGLQRHRTWLRLYGSSTPTSQLFTDNPLLCTASKTSSESSPRTAVSRSSMSGRLRSLELKTT